jgi:hypothetical protein
MKKYYVLLIYLIFNVTGKSQVQSSWYEDFEAMTINQPPSGNWLVGNSIVMGYPHGNPGLGDNQHSLSSYLNTGIQTDSIFTPKLTGFQGVDCGYNFYYRICNWLGNTITSPVTLSIDDTCSLSIYKYSGSNLVGIIPVYKIHSGNHNPDTNYTFSPGNQFPNIIYSDTFRIAIHIKKGVLGNYWYDFDRFQTAYYTGINSVSTSTKIHIYPNPVKNEINFKLDYPTQNIQIIDIYGKSIEFREESNHHKHQIHLNSSLAPGIYFISIKTDKETINSKFLKE